MGIIETIIDAFTHNHVNMTNVQRSRLIDTINMTVSNGMKEKNSETNVQNTVDNNGLITQSAGFFIEQSMQERETILTRECYEIEEKLKDKNLSKDQVTFLKSQKDGKYKELLKVRAEYDKARNIIANCKTPYYTSDEKKRNKKDTDSIAGVEDPFYESFKELYADGLMGLVNGNDKSTINNKQLKTIRLASERYSKMEGLFPKMGKILKIPLMIGLFLTYPMVSSIMNPIVYGVGMYSTIMGTLLIPEALRGLKNKKIFEARDRIGRDLGLIKKNLRKLGFKGVLQI